MKQIIKQNKLPIVILFFLITLQGFAQDTIIKRDGQQITGKVLEVSTTEVKYKREQQPDGPVFVESKSLIDQIRYSNGTKDVFPVTESRVILKEELPSYYSKNPEIEIRRSKYFMDGKPIGEGKLYRQMLQLNKPDLTALVKSAKQAKALRYIGFAAIPFCIFGATIVATTDFDKNILSTSDYNRGRTIGFSLLAGAAISIGTSAYFKQKYKRCNAQIVGLYNTKYR